MAVVIPLKLVYTPVDATVTAIRNYQVPSTAQVTVTLKINNQHTLDIKGEKGFFGNPD